MDDQLLSGAVICCTSIAPEQRSILAQYAEDMGAVHKYDLTSDVTHLIVGDSDTPKYKFVARERMDVKCVLPSWLEAIRESWMAGEETELVVLEERHRLPTFYGLNICVTGFVDADERKAIEDLIVANGGNYMPNLTKDEHYLIAKEPAGAKYEFAEKWRVKIVAIEWLEQSIQRGMVLEFSLFHPFIPVEKRGEGAWIRKDAGISKSTKHARDGDDGAPRSRKLRRTASARLSDQNSGLWGDISVAEFKPPPAKKSIWDDDDDVEMIAQPPEKREPVREPPEPKMSETRGNLLGQPNREWGIFQGKYLVLNGFDERQATVVRNHAETRGAVTLDYSDFESQGAGLCSPATYVLIPHTLSFESLPLNLQEFPQERLGTEFWIERCMHLKKFEEPSKHPSSRPFRALSLPAFRSLKVSISGFQSFELLHVSKAIRALGGLHAEDFVASGSLLICNPDNATIGKLRAAYQWNIPAVNIDWLWECARQGHAIPYDRYLIQPLTRAPVFDATSDLRTTNTNASNRQKSSSSTRPQNEASLSKGMKPSYAESVTSKTSQKTSQPARRFQRTSVDPFPDSAGPPMNQVDRTESSSLLPGNLPAGEHSSQQKAVPQANVLREITPNSSPPKPRLSQKAESESESLLTEADCKEDTPPSWKSPTNNGPSVAETITSLLADRHSRAITTTLPNDRPASKPPSQQHQQPPHPAGRRRRRQLLGRAPSNLSHHSNNDILSREGSVDTMLTETLHHNSNSNPTPLSSGAIIPSNNNNTGAGGAGAKILASFGPSGAHAVQHAGTHDRDTGSGSKVVYDNAHAEEEERRREEQALLSTQLGYGDEDALLALRREEAGATAAAARRRMGRGGADCEDEDERVGGGKEEGGRQASAGERDWVGKQSVGGRKGKVAAGGGGGGRVTTYGKGVTPRKAATNNAVGGGGAYAARKGVRNEKEGGLGIASRTRGQVAR